MVPTAEPVEDFALMTIEFEGIQAVLSSILSRKRVAE
jgi:hypothetical protein